MSSPDPRQSSLELLEALQGLARTLEELGIGYYVGGSVASSILGVMRATADIDVVVDLRRGDARRLVVRLAAECHGDAEAAESALHQARPFNVIHLQTMLKFDFFPVAEDPLSLSAMRRAWQLASGVRVATAEDILLAKLRWFRAGGEQSDRQWGDVLGLLRARGPRLEHEYLHRSAESLGVLDLLQRALGQA